MMVRPFTIEDFGRMKMKADCWALSADRRLIEAYLSAGPSWVLLGDDDEVIVCGGFVFGGWPGIADVWIIPGQDIGKHPMRVVKEVRGHLNHVIKSLGLYRVQATIMESEVHWIELFGFTREGLLRKFGPNKEDKYIYARVE